MNKKPVIAISACLLGHAVRYDGKHKKHIIVSDRLNQLFDFMPVCPEVGIGLDVPRPPVQLVSFHAKIRAIGIDDRKIDITEQLEGYAHQQIDQFQNVSGFIFKSKSPSCGLGTTRVIDSEHSDSLFMGSGLFSQIICNRYSDIPCCDELFLEDPEQLSHFIESVQKVSSGQNQDF
jgi:uncharacterized protein YbbK (DUF523 family)